MEESKFQTAMPQESQIDFIKRSLVEKQWNAGKGANTGEESFCKNPWRFFENGYFVTMRDEHHGVWKLSENKSKIHLELQWKSNDGKAVFELQQNNDWKCVTWPWDFLKNWRIVNQQVEGTGPEDENIIAKLESFMVSNKMKAGNYRSPEEHYDKNPWKFKSDRTFVTERDGHHGVWEIKNAGGRYELYMHWENHEGFAIFQFNHLGKPGINKDNVVNLNCMNGGWGFMKAWNIAAQ